MFTITREKIENPVKGVIFSQGGMGKTTLARKLLPNAIYFDPDNSITGDHKGKVNLAPVKWGHYDQVTPSLTYAFSDPSMQMYDSIIIDCVDQIEFLAAQKVMYENNWAHMEVIDFGKCWTPVQDMMFRLFDYIFDCADKYGVNVLFISHSRTIPTDDNSRNEKIDVWYPDLNKKIAKELIYRSEFAFYIRNKEHIGSVDAGFGQTKAKVQSFQRVIETETTPFWAAKQRSGLDATIPFDHETFDYDSLRAKLGFTSSRKNMVTPPPIQEPVQEPIQDFNEELKEAEKKELEEIEGKGSNNIDPGVMPEPTINHTVSHQQLKDKIKDAGITEYAFMYLAGNKFGQIVYPEKTKIECYTEDYVNSILGNFNVISEKYIKDNEFDLMAEGAKIEEALGE